MLLPTNISEQGKQFACFLKEWIESGISFDARLAVLVRKHWGISSDEGQIIAPLVLMMIEPGVRQQWILEHPAQYTLEHPGYSGLSAKREEGKSGHAEQAGTEHGYQREPEQAG